MKPPVSKSPAMKTTVPRKPDVTQPVEVKPVVITRSGRTVVQPDRFQAAI